MSSQRRFTAISDFRQARQRAALQELLARVTGKSVELLSYDTVLRELKATGAVERGLRDIPLAAIAGSVGRAGDYTRDFLPRRSSDEQRWAAVRAAVTDPQSKGLPPIEVYQIGDAYFVLDGHHRVSVARQLGGKFIEAYVTEVHTKVPLSAEVQPEELIVKAEYADFLEQTRLDGTRPGADLSVSEPGQIGHLLSQIELYRQRAAEQGRPLDLPVAASDWYDEVYLPVVAVIRELGLVLDLPQYTEADLYLLVSAHRTALQEALGWTISPEVGATNLAAQQAAQRAAPVVRAGRRLLRAVVPDELKDGPAAGDWRRERLAARYSDRLFADILVPVSGEPPGWLALDQALVIAQRERATLHGLHVVAGDALVQSGEALAVRAEFARRCQEAGIDGQLLVEAGEVARQICLRAALVDLVVLNLAHPPARERLARLSSGLRGIIRRCPRPVLAVPQVSSAPRRVLLAYDGSPKAREGLFVAAYLGEAWGVGLTVVSIIGGPATTEAVDYARQYLEMHELDAAFVVRPDGSATDITLEVAEDVQADLIVAGGYGARPVVEMVMGSEVDELLRLSQRPILICR